MNINELLPNLASYKEQFINGGISYPVPTINFSENGLLAELPKSIKKGWPWDRQTKPSRYQKDIKWPKITIVTPSYNQGKYIEETIRAVLLQNYPNLEYIVMDGGSTDETQQILENYSPWISYWQSKKDNGQGNAINLGFSLASGEIYGWINSDDFYMEDSFFKLAEAYSKGKPDFLYGDCLVIDEKKKKIFYEKANYVIAKYLFSGGILMQHSCFWKAEIHEPILEQLHCAVDSELWFRLVPKRKLKHVKFPLGIVRIQPDAKTQNSSFVEKWKADNTLIAQLHRFDKNISFFKYIQSWFYPREVIYVQKLYKFFSTIDEQKYLSKIKNFDDR
ncbi:glycosyltransferase family 2 protein [Pedobacter sp. KLB.chiD]|uniref:glycosyltransferase family 2 protein n=1 Tax=Pedobacter sp. KLB.chiD TaxID=3387402 RepID=UPI00399B646C